jgi:maltose-binding protein MalE
MVPLPQTPAWNKVSAAINKAVNDTLTGAKAPREALNEAQRDAQIALDEFKR